MANLKWLKYPNEIRIISSLFYTYPAVVMITDLCTGEPVSKLKHEQLGNRISITDEQKNDLWGLRNVEVVVDGESYRHFYIYPDRNKLLADPEGYRDAWILLEALKYAEDYQHDHCATTSVKDICMMYERYLELADSKPEKILDDCGC